MRSLLGLVLIVFIVGWSCKFLFWLFHGGFKTLEEMKLSRELQDIANHNSSPEFEKFTNRQKSRKLSMQLTVVVLCTVPAVILTGLLSPVAGFVTFVSAIVWIKSCLTDIANVSRE